MVETQTEGDAARALGHAFLDAFRARDFDRFDDLLAPTMRFRALIASGHRDFQSVLERAQRQLPLIVLSEPVAGKNLALNRALARARGSLLLFTDDDGEPTAAWLANHLAAMRRYPETNVFAGPVVPSLPLDAPEWLRSHHFASGFYGRFEPQSTDATVFVSDPS